MCLSHERRGMTREEAGTHFYNSLRESSDIGKEHAAGTECIRPHF